jgi:hypothetical protein
VADDGPFHAKLQESAEHLFVDVLNVVLEHAESVSIDATLLGIGAAIRRWARRRRQFRGGDGDRPTAVIWGPDGEIISEVELPDPADD